MTNALNLLNSIRSQLKRSKRFVHTVIFGHRNLLLTNALISASMGALGDSIQQNFDILTESIKTKQKINQNNNNSDDNNNDGNNDNEDQQQSKAVYSTTRTIHMTAAGLTTGILTHYWYLLLDRYFSGRDKSKVNRRNFKILIKLVLLDQILFSPINLFVYFGTLSLCERSSWQKFRQELMEKGMENIYIMEWLIWPPAQFINFALLPLRYRILFDNLVSLGFDIYGPYVKYKKPLSDEQQSAKLEPIKPEQT